MTRMAIAKVRVFPLGVLQVFAPIRMGNVPDCSQSHRSLGCHPSASPPEAGSAESGELFDRKQVNILDIRLCLAVPCRKCSASAVAC